MTEARRGPLRGVRVVDFTANMSGPMATMILGDQGADVIKVEPPGGDILRCIGTAAGSMSAYFGNLNRSKRSLVIDLTRPEAEPTVRALLDGADVVVQNYRPGVAERFGLDADTVRRDRPGLICAEISGYGSGGPFSAKPAYDHVLQAMSGFVDRQRTRDAAGPPTMIRQGIIDKITGQVTAQAITASLFERTRSGVGRSITISMLDVALATLWPDGMMDHTIDHPDARRTSVADTYRLIETIDGEIVFILVTAARLKRLAVALGLPHADDLPDDGPLYSAGGLLRQANDRLAELTRAQAVELLDSLGIPVSAVIALDEIASHPQVVASGSVDEFEHPVMGPVHQANPAVRFGHDRAHELPPAPSLGEHSTAILDEIGLDRQEIKRLRGIGVVHQDDSRPDDAS